MCTVFTTKFNGTVFSNDQIYGGDFAKFCVLLRINELYLGYHFAELQDREILKDVDETHLKVANSTPIATIGDQILIVLI